MLLFHYRTLLLDLDTRLSAAEQQLARLAPAQSGSSSTLLSVIPLTLPHSERHSLKLPLVDQPPDETIRAYRDSDPLLASLAAAAADLAVPPPSPPPLNLRRASSSRRKSSSSSSSSSPDPQTKGNPLVAVDRSSVSTTPEDDISPPPGTKAPPPSTNPGASSSSLNPTLTTAHSRSRRPQQQQQPTTVTAAAAGSDLNGGGTDTVTRTTSSLRPLDSSSSKPIPAYLAAKRARAAAAAKLATADSEKGLADEDEDEDELAAAVAAADDDPDDAVVKKLDDLIPADSTPVGGAGAGNESLLGQHHALQTSLLSSLTSLSGALKQSTLSFSDNLAKDKEVVTRAQEQLEQSEAGMKKQQVRLKDVRGKSRGTTWWTLGLLAIVFMLWFLTFLLIKVT